MVSNSAFRGTGWKEVGPVGRDGHFFQRMWDEWELSRNHRIAIYFHTIRPSTRKPTSGFLVKKSYNWYSSRAKTHNHLIHGKFMEGNGCWLCLLRCHIPFRKGSMFLGDWRAFKELVIKRSCVKAVCRSSTWRWYRVPLIVQKCSDDHLGCIKEVVNVETKYYHTIWWLPVNPCKSWAP